MGKIEELIQDITDDLMEKENVSIVIKHAINAILNIGQCDGGHHKQYALDQTLRALTGGSELNGYEFTKTPAYNKLIELYQDGEDGP